MFKSAYDEFVEQGRREALQQVLEQQLKARFGALGATARAKIAKAKTADLERWTLRVIKAKSVAEVLRPRRRPSS